MTRAATRKITRIKGTVASTGIASGEIFSLLDADSATAPDAAADAASTPELAAALSQAAAQLTRILETIDDTDEALGMIEFQLAMVEDDTFREAAGARIKQGESALSAWNRVLNDEIADYQSAEDDYFRARTIDLVDIRDRVSAILRGAQQQTVPPNRILLATDLTPSLFLATDWERGGIALVNGSVNSHVAMLARSRRIPMIVGLAEMPETPAADAILDAESGELVMDPDAAEIEQALERIAEIKNRQQRERQNQELNVSLEDGSRIAVSINIADPDELAEVDINHCDGIGLVRTEFLFSGREQLPSEDAQYQVYRRIVEWAQGKPVTLRTLDAGGDKPVHGLTLDGETNPFLGVRGIRLSLRQRAEFETQLRAMLRAAALGPVKIMLPMVTLPEEIATTRELLALQKQRLDDANIARGEPLIGIMVEVPAVAICIEDFDADFYSIGSNDLLQYVTACSRDATGLDHLAMPDSPAMIKLLEYVIAHGRVYNIEVSLCGEMASDSRYTALLLNLGLRNFSVAPESIAAIKTAVIHSGL